MTNREINWRFAGGAATCALVILLWGWLRGYKGLEWIPLFLAGFVIPGLVAARTFQELRENAGAVVREGDSMKNTDPDFSEVIYACAMISLGVVVVFGDPPWQ